MSLWALGLICFRLNGILTIEDTVYRSLQRLGREAPLSISFYHLEHRDDSKTREGIVRGNRTNYSPV